MARGDASIGAAVSIDNGREGRPGDRGDATMRSGMAKLRGGGSPQMPNQLTSECSKGYEPAPPSSWYGNVNR